MRILGVDPALKRTGYGIVDWTGSKIRMAAGGTIETKTSDLMPKRLADIYRGMLTVIDEYAPQIMVLEKVFVHYHHPATAFILGQARGIMCLACAATGMELSEFSATQVKKAVVGKGQASKEQVKRMVSRLLMLPETPKYHDTTDALALAITYRYMHATVVRGGL
jgi:crossover junction endodeoxyribonuclease RuvC